MKTEISRKLLRFNKKCDNCGAIIREFIGSTLGDIKECPVCGSKNLSEIKEYKDELPVTICPLKKENKE